MLHAIFVQYYEDIDGSNGSMRRLDARIYEYAATRRDWQLDINKSERRHPKVQG